MEGTVFYSQTTWHVQPTETFFFQIASLANPEPLHWRRRNRWGKGENQKNQMRKQDFGRILFKSIYYIIPVHIPVHIHLTYTYTYGIYNIYVYQCISRPPSPSLISHISQKFSESNSTRLLQMLINVNTQWMNMDRIKYIWLDHSIMIYSKFDLDMFRDDVNQISLILEILLFTDRHSNMNLAKRLGTENCSRELKEAWNHFLIHDAFFHKWYKTSSNHQPSCSAWFSLFNSRHFFEWRSQVVRWNWSQPTPPWNSTFHKRDIRTGSKSEGMDRPCSLEHAGWVAWGFSKRTWPHF